MLPIFVISLPQDHERYHDLLEHHRLHASYLSMTKVDGILGSDLTSYENYKACSSFLYRPWLTTGMLGCGLSHLKALQQFLNNDDGEVALILEDDARIRPGISTDQWTFLIDQMKTKEMDILHLGGHETESGYQMLVRGNIQNMDAQSIQNTGPVFWWSTTAAYLVSRKGAEQILNELKGNMIYHLDIVYHGLLQKGVIRGECVDRPWFFTKQYKSHNATQDRILSRIIHRDILHLILSMSVIHIPGIGSVTLLMILGGMFLSILPWPAMILVLLFARGKILLWWSLQFIIIMMLGRTGRIFFFTFWTIVLLLFLMIFVSVSSLV